MLFVHQKTNLPYLKDEEIVHLKKYTNEYAITSKRVAIYGHTPAADYYNIASYLTKYPSNSIRVDRKIFLRCCEVAAITNRTKISINIGENLMEISASGNGGKVENRMKKPIIYYGHTKKMPRSRNTDVL